MSDQSKRPRVAAVVVSWNLRERVIETVGALNKESAVEKIILADNGSRDGTPQAVRQAFPTVEVIENGKNIGYAAGNNVGIRRALDMAADYVLLINSDAAPESGAIDSLIAAAIEENAGAVGGKPVRRDDPSTLDAAWGVINWRNVASYLEGEGKPDGPAYSVRRPVDYPLGVALLVSAKALRDVGLFDEEYFAYHEEMELCERLRRAGWPVIFEPARFLHGGSESLKSAGAELGREYLLARNSVKFLRKYGSTSNKIKFWVFVAAASVLKIPAEIARGRISAHFARINGWLDGLISRKSNEPLRKYGLIE